MKKIIVFICVCLWIPLCYASESGGASAAASDDHRPSLTAVLISEQAIGSPCIHGKAAESVVLIDLSKTAEIIPISLIAAVGMPLVEDDGKMSRTLYGFRYSNGQEVLVNRDTMPKPHGAYILVKLPLKLGDGAECELKK